MPILLNREGFETSLPDMAARSAETVIAADMGGHQPLHEHAEVAVLIRPQQQMEVIGHQAVAKHGHGDPLGRLCQQRKKVPVVPLVMENSGAGIAAVYDVVADAAN